ncbi:cell wall assembly regulator SMI1 [Sphingomonas kaistensis]|uniref:Cell wall assembly regulator SMI1 n=1 Tax=Sphingomonas kaistensis TaxID=298708 RepID=A0A7X5Y5M2_9SPHN|nr:SMI1/KNR4 family protein [Sphingomonas kaistensis]NJC04315.1 cell wall assembly regulator SMI1 [Sphingomonas kaistensis]
MDAPDPNRRLLLIGGSILAAVVAAGVAPTACAMRNITKGPTGMTTAPPPRPPGKPKPLLDEDIGPVLARLDAWYAAHLPADRYRWNPPASEEQLAAFEKAVGRTMPQSWRQLYRWHNGENEDRWGHFYGLPLCSLEFAAGDWQIWQQGLDWFGGNRYAIPGAGWPAGAVDPAYINLARIPLTVDRSGNNIGLDFDPWPGGRVGQVIIYGRDEDVKVVLAESLGGFLGWIADLLEAGNFRLDAVPGEQRLRLFRLKTPAVDHFHEGARLLLGAPKQYL